MTSPHVRARLRCPVVAIACGIVGVMVASSCAGSDTPEPDPVVASEVLAANLGRPRDVSERSNDPDQPGDADSVEVTNPADSSGGTGADESGGGLSTKATVVPVIKSADAPRVPGIDPFSHPTMPQEELERFIAAVETLDRDATCPPTVVPASLDGYAEVLRIADGCMHIEYHPFEGRTIWQARYEIMQADPTVFAVGFPSDDLEPDQAADLDYGDYDQWHLEYLDVRELQAGWPNDQDDKIIVAVIDTGVSEHDAIDERLENEESDNCSLTDYHGHGTRVAGIIAAEDTPGLDVVGIAPMARILSISFATSTDVSDCAAEPTLAVLLNEASNSNVDIINMSLHMRPMRSHLYDGDSLSGPTPSERAIQRLSIEQDVVVVASSGNCGRSDDCDVLNQLQGPARFEHVIAVANVDENGNRRDTSTANNSVDIAAPGAFIRSLKSNGGTIEKEGGTSMASPMVAGVVAHMKARFPKATVTQITEALFNTAGRPAGNVNCDIPLTSGDCYGHGIVQPLAAIDYLAALNPRIAYVTDETGPLEIALTDPTDPDGENGTVTDSSGGNYGPSLSPDGSRIVFARNEGSGNDLWVVNVDGSEEPLTDSRQSEYAPSWSPDGSQIVFIRDNSTSDTKSCGFLWLSTCREYVHRASEIVVMNSDKSGEDEQLFVGENIFTPQWTSDGKAILFDYNGDIASLDLASKNVRIVLDDGRNYCPSPSPDSEMIAYSSDRTGNEEIYIMGADGGNPRPITDHAANDRCPVWMPDGESLVFTSDRDGDDEIYIVGIDDKIPLQLTDNDHRDFQPSVTKSGEAAAVIASTDLTVQRIDSLPVAVDDAGGEFDALDSSWDHVCSSLEDRASLCWGTTASGPESASPDAQTSASAGGNHSCALDAGDSVVCWGSGFLGQTDAPEGSFRAVAAGWDHTCGLNSSGGIECWGSDQHGQASPPSGRFTAITAGDGHSCALDGDGAITCWGLNEDGQASPPSGRFTVIDTGSAHSCALDGAGRITCWGANWFGQTDTPVGSFVGVAAGYGHTCALDQGGFATCWGLNNDYQANAPYRVFTTITAGRAHTCGLDIHAEVMCWGTLEPDET